VKWSVIDCAVDVDGRWKGGALGVYEACISGGVDEGRGRSNAKDNSSSDSRRPANLRTVHNSDGCDSTLADMLGGNCPQRRQMRRSEKASSTLTLGRTTWKTRIDGEKPAEEIQVGDEVERIVKSVPFYLEPV